MKKRALILCTGNSCRSQMAEAIINDRLAPEWEAVSAGTHPCGYVHPKALRVLQEIGIRHDGRSKSVDEFRDQRFDLVVTVCGSAAEHCPQWVGVDRRVHLGVADPTGTLGSEHVVLEAFRVCRDTVSEKVLGYLASEFGAVPRT